MWRSFIKDQRIGVRLFITVSLPIVILLVFAGQNLYQSFSTYSQMKRIDKLASFSPAMTNLVHELQKERGASAGFIGSKGNNRFATKLVEQKLQTDRMLDRFSRVAKAIDTEAGNPHFSSLLSLAQKALGELGAMRARVDKLSTSVKGMASYYTKTIARLLDAVSYMAVLSPDPTLSRQLTAYTSFLQAKERAGQERAMGAVGFGAGHFSPEIHQKFATLIAQQKAYLDLFNHSASTKLTGFYKQKMASDIVSQVENMRRIGIDSIYSNSGTKLPVSGTAWFDAITAKINLMKDVEDHISADIASYTQHHASAYSRWYYGILVLVSSVLVITMLFVTKISHSIIAPIGKVTKYMTRLANGDNSAELRLEERKDEIGDMMKSIAVFESKADNAIPLKQRINPRQRDLRPTRQPSPSSSWPKAWKS